MDDDLRQPSALPLVPDGPTTAHVQRLSKDDGGYVTFAAYEWAAARIAELERELGNLLAIIHRDGGHYMIEHGARKAVEDANTEWGKLVQRTDAAESRTQLAEARAGELEKTLLKIREHETGEYCDGGNDLLCYQCDQMQEIARAALSSSPIQGARDE